METRCAPLYTLVMQLNVNGQPRQTDPATRTAGDLLNELNIQRERVAVVINENVVRRANLDETPINDGDTIEIITMVGGG